ncbi:MAG: NUDIX domain-containing protein [Clostridium sp.]|nr:NUDIX domain-containing protein [Clostridium sp.]
MNNKHPFESFLFCPRCGSNRFVVHNEKSKHCEQCHFTYYFNPSAATVALITNRQGELLVCRRAKEPAMGTLDLPGGFCDCFESGEQGVIREVKEETGLTVSRTDFLFSLPNTYLYSDFLVHTVDLFFRCHVDDTSPLSAMDDAADVFWIPFAQVNPDLFGLDSIRMGLKRFMKTVNDQPQNKHSKKIANI